MASIDLTRADLAEIRAVYAESGHPSQRELARRYHISPMTVRRILRGEDPYLRADVEAAFWAKVDRSGGTEACWLWTGAQNENGYGRSHYGREHMGAHRAAWLWSGRTLTPGLEVDHLCRTRLCVNPLHLEEVTHRENSARAASLITHCPQGHPYDEANTVRNSNGGRMCRQCQAYHKRAWERRQAESGITCSNCPKGPVYALGRCRSCYLFFKRHDRDRTEEERVAWNRRRFEREVYRRLIRDVILAAEGEIA